jgi:hypothetical protein
MRRYAARGTAAQYQSHLPVLRTRVEGKSRWQWNRKRAYKNLTSSSPRESANESADRTIEQSVADRLLTAIRDDIIAGKLPPGTECRATRCVKRCGCCATKG